MALREPRMTLREHRGEALSGEFPGGGDAGGEVR